MSLLGTLKAGNPILISKNTVKLENGILIPKAVSSAGHQGDDIYDYIHAYLNWSHMGGGASKLYSKLIILMVISSWSTEIKQAL